MIYVDTSALVAYYCPEPLSEKVETFLMSQTRPIISTLTEIELFSAVSKKGTDEGDETERCKPRRCQVLG